MTKMITVVMSTTPYHRRLVLPRTSVSDDDGASRRHSKSRGTETGNTLKRDELKPWGLPDQLIDSLSHETSQYH